MNWILNSIWRSGEEESSLLWKDVSDLNEIITASWLWHKFRKDYEEVR